MSTKKSSHRTNYERMIRKLRRHFLLRKITDNDFAACAAGDAVCRSWNDGRVIVVYPSFNRRARRGWSS